MPAKFQFASAFLCERVLFERDNIISAIRIVDVFGVPENPPPDFVVVFFLVVSLKTLPAQEREYQIRVNLIRPSGEKLSNVGTGLVPQRAVFLDNDSSIPNGISIVLQMAVEPKALGNCIIEIEIDGEVEVTVPFTLRRVPVVPLARKELRN